jgi:hypothetical protein
MTRIEELLAKRKELTATLEEEIELLELVKTVPQEEFDKIDESLLKISSEGRLGKMISLIDKMIEKINETQ